MKEFLNQSVFFGVAISVLTYELGVFLKKKLKSSSKSMNVRMQLKIHEGYQYSILQRD